MTRNSDIASRLKHFRTSKGMTLADMEKITGIPAQTINRYELGQRAPKIDVATAIADALNVNPLWLQGYDVPENKPAPETEGELSAEALRIAMKASLLSDESRKALESYIDYLAAKGHQ